jgi:hypothetical protein
MVRYVDPLFHNTMLDTNLLDEIVSGTHPAVARMVGLNENEEIIIVLPYSVRAELNDPATPAPVRAAASNFIYSIRVQLTATEIARRDRLIKEAQGNSQRKNVDRDLHHIFETGRCGGGHFVTRDAWLLRNAERIWSLAQVEVVTPEQFVEKTELALKLRPARGEMPRT